MKFSKKPRRPSKPVTERSREKPAIVSKKSPKKGQSTCIDQSLGTLISTGSGSPFFSAFLTASSYDFP